MIIIRCSIVRDPLKNSTMFGLLEQHSKRRCIITSDNKINGYEKKSMIAAVLTVRIKLSLENPPNEPTSNPRNWRKVTMTSTTQPVIRKFARRLRALNWIEGCETDAPMVRKRKRINSAASMASDNPKLHAVAVSPPEAFRVRALI